MRPDLDPAEHGPARELLAAYADGALSEADTRRVEAHLAGCEPCRQQVLVQTAIRAHLTPTETFRAPAELQDRIRRATYGGAARGPRGRPSHAAWVRPAAWAGWAIAAGLGALLLLRPAPQPKPPLASRTEPAASADTADVPMVRDALADFRRRTGGALPLTPEDLAQVEAQIPFPVVPLRSPELRLLGGWRVQILGQPAAALAYQWRDRVLVQYIVADSLFYAPREVRQAVERQGEYVTSVGDQGVVAWPGPQSGSILIGGVPPAELAGLRS